MQHSNKESERTQYVTATRTVYEKGAIPVCNKCLLGTGLKRLKGDKKEEAFTNKDGS